MSGRPKKRRRARLRHPGVPDPRMKHHLPYPELVEDKPNDTPYQIFDSNKMDGLISNGMTDKEDRKLIVPLNRNGHVVSNHELAHVKWSPERWPTISYHPHCFLAVEDGRINIGLENIGLPMDVPRGERAQIGKLANDDLERGDYGMLILRGLASLGTNVEDLVFEPLEDAPDVIRQLGEELREFVRTRLERAAHRAKKPVAPNRAVNKIAKEVARRLEAFELIEKGGPKSITEVKGCLVCGPPKKGDQTLDLDLDIGGIDFDAFEHGVDEEGRRQVDSGKMSILRAPLAMRILDRHRALERRWRPATEGSVVTSVHRLPLDGAIFRRPVRRRGGTVLIDVSGSMRLDAAAIDHLVRVAGGAAVVAMYSGSGEDGELRIIARDGRRAVGEHLEPYGQGNVVDLPALQWLSSQAAPRIWISDGNVSGVGDRASKGLRRACAAVTRAGKIERLPNVDEAVKRLGVRGRSR